MDNHVHMMISEGVEDIAKVMKRITVSYVYYFNNKYKRSGHLFQDRFRSETLENDRYMLSLTRYIHQNPVKAAIVKTATDYRWNSYLGKNTYFAKMLDMETILGLFSNDKEQAIKLFEKDMRQYENLKEKPQESFIDLQEAEKFIDEEEAKKLFKNILEEHGIDSHNCTKAQFSDDIVQELKETTKLSIRKISSITGLNKDKIHKILNR